MCRPLNTSQDHNRYCDTSFGDSLFISGRIAIRCTLTSPPFLTLSVFRVCTNHDGNVKCPWNIMSQKVSRSKNQWTSVICLYIASGSLDCSFEAYRIRWISIIVCNVVASYRQLNQMKVIEIEWCFRNYIYYQNCGLEVE